QDGRISQAEPQRLWILTITASQRKPDLSPLNSGHRRRPSTCLNLDPRRRKRYSFKERKGMVSHAPSAKAKQHVWKPPKETPKSAKVPSITNDKADKKNMKGSKAKKKPEEASSSAGPATYAGKDKKSLIFSFDWHHPTSSLEVVMLEANTKQVFLDSSGIQQEVVKCIEEGFSLAVDGQKTNGERLPESERLKARRDALSEDEREILDNLAGAIKPTENSSDEDDIEDSQDGAGGEDSEDLEEDDNKHLRFL
ncbi:hypothetical protein BGW39_003993, partial [Mortierella sp. 14UC]